MAAGLVTAHHEYASRFGIPAALQQDRRTTKLVCHCLWIALGRIADLSLELDLQMSSSSAHPIIESWPKLDRKNHVMLVSAESYG